MFGLHNTDVRETSSPADEADDINTSIASWDDACKCITQSTAADHQTFLMQASFLFLDHVQDNKG